MMWEKVLLGSRRYPLLFPVAGTAAGILASAHFATLAGLGWKAWACVLLLATLAWCSGSGKLCLLLLVVSAFFLGAARMGDRAFRPPPDFLQAWVETQQTVHIWLEAREYCQTEGNLSRFRAHLLGYFAGSRLQPVSAEVMVKVGDPICQAAPGKRFQAWGKFSVPRRFQNPFSFDYPRYLRLQGIQATLYLKGKRFLLPWGEGPGIFWNTADKIRIHLFGVLRRHLAPSSARGVLEALLVGEQGGLSPRIEEVFRATGLTHLLVVSGLHLTLVFVLFLFPIYGFLSLHPSWSDGGWAKRLAMLAALAPTVLYAAVVGPGPSVVRALTFAALTVFLFWQAWKSEGVSVLIFSFGSYLICDPAALFDLSFQFSYLAVGVLFFSGKKILSLVRNLEGPSSFWKRGPPKWIAILLFTNFAINVSLFPWMAEVFHEASMVAPLANLLAVPLFTFLIHPLSWIGVAVDTMNHSAGGLLLHALEVLLIWVLRGMEWLASWPFASVLIPPLPILFWVGFGLGAIALGLHPGWPRRWILLACLVMVVGIGWKVATREDVTGILSLTVLDVGQGESLLIGLPDGTSLLMDGGGFPYSDFDIGRQVVLPELLGKSVGGLRALILTHPDADHLKGLVTVARRWKVGEFWYPRAAEEDPNLAPLREILLEEGIPLRTLGQGDRLEAGEVDFEVLWPQVGEEKRFSDNNRSLVIKMCHWEVCFYLTGDLEAEGEELLDLGARRGAFRILKVAHHGSRTSSSFEFVDKLRPHLALISAGSHNRYGHPHAEVIRRFMEAGIPVLRTDQEGQIEIRTDGRLVFYRTFSGKVGVEVAAGALPLWWESLWATVGRFPSW